MSVPTLTAETAHHYVPYFVSTGRTKTLHLPSETTPKDTPTPACGYDDVTGGWRAVATEAYPPAWRDLCRNCKALARGDPTESLTAARTRADHPLAVRFSPTPKVPEQ